MFRRLLGVGVLVFAAGSVRARIHGQWRREGCDFFCTVAADPALAEEGGDLRVRCCN